MQPLALTGISKMAQVSQCPTHVYLPVFSAEFAQAAMLEGSVFVPRMGGSLDDILCVEFERTVVANKRMLPLQIVERILYT